MPRVVKEHEYAAKRGEILDTAQRLVAVKGYEQMTIQDILDDLRISKGAFYHYFASKPDVLEAIIERMLGEAEQLLDAIVHDPDLPVLEKFGRFFAVAARWKSARKSLIVDLVHVWYNDDNAIVRQKLRSYRGRRIAPMITTMIHQGIREGVFSTPYPDDVGEVFMDLLEDFGDRFGELLLSGQPEPDSARIERAAAVYTDALERILGAPPGSLQLVDSETIQEWVNARF